MKLSDILITTALSVAIISIGMIVVKENNLFEETELPPSVTASSTLSNTQLTKALVSVNSQLTQQQDQSLSIVMSLLVDAGIVKVERDQQGNITKIEAIKQ